MAVLSKNGTEIARIKSKHTGNLLSYRSNRRVLMRRGDHWIRLRTFPTEAQMHEHLEKMLTSGAVLLVQ